MPGFCARIERLIRSTAIKMRTKFKIPAKPGANGKGHTHRRTVKFTGGADRRICFRLPISPADPEIAYPHYAERLRLCGLGTRGSVGVIGIRFGGFLAPRLAACFASASLT